VEGNSRSDWRRGLRGKRLRGSDKRWGEKSKRRILDVYRTSNVTPLGFFHLKGDSQACGVWCRIVQASRGTSKGGNPKPGKENPAIKVPGVTLRSRNG